VGYIEAFTEALTMSSVADDYHEAIEEWVAYGERFIKAGECICGHPITENCPVYNKLNRNVLIVGNCCIKKFGIERASFNRSKKAYLELALQKVNNGWESTFIGSMLEQLEQYEGRFAPTYKQRGILQRITGQKYRWKIRSI